MKPATAFPAARSGILLVALFAIVGFGAALAQEAGAGRPQRIVSLNLCTDELLMRLVEPERIASITYLSHEAEQTPPDLAEIVAGIPANHGLAEEVIMQEPDLIVAGTFSARPAVALLRRLGYRVVDFQPAGDFATMRANIRLMGEATGETARAEAMIADMDARLARLPGAAGPDAPVYADIQANLRLQGEGTLDAAVANAAGYRALGQELGFSYSGQVSLEQVILSEPDLITLGEPGTYSIASALTRHPALRRLAETTPAIAVPPRYLTCDSPLAVRAAEMLAEKRAELGRGAGPAGE